ncbi:MAG: flagellar export chaperone FliS [Nitrospinaceae bacterium]
MVPAKYHHEYRRNEISTSSQGKLILMMYEGAMKFTRMALHSLEKGDISGKGLYIQKTHDIINELSVSLNLKKGGEVASKLETLYQFILSQLTLANIKSDREALESILKVLHPLEEAWRELFHTSNAQEVEKPRIPKSIASKI